MFKVKNITNDRDENNTEPIDKITDVESENKAPVDSMAIKEEI